MTETSTTSNGFEIKNPTDKLSAEVFRDRMGSEYGINGKTPHERIEQLKTLSNEGIAIFLEDVNKSIQGSQDSLINHEKVMKIGDVDSIHPEDRYEVFTRMVDLIKKAPGDINPARVGDTLALGVVLLHPFHDGNGRTARMLGLMFRENYDNDDFKDDYETVIEPRDAARERGGFMINGYIPRFAEGFDQSDHAQVSNYLESLLDEDHPDQYTGCFGQAPLFDK